MTATRVLLGAALVALVWGAPVGAQRDDATRVEYRLTFPEPAHRWLVVDATFSGLPQAPLVARMSSASPGRYARHEFVKNVIELAATDGAGRTLPTTRPDAYSWSVQGHDGTVRLRYRLFGDLIDGTYMAVDSTHAHLNMPATLIWAQGLEDRPVRVVFEPPDESTWRVATQLYPTDDPRVFTAPNLQYLLDSPAELSDFDERTFQVSDPTTPSYRPAFRVAVHHEGDDTAVDRYARDVERVVREMVTVFGEFPRFETGAYTFIADYLPYARGDAMEHRNSTVLTSRSGLGGSAQTGLVGSVAHEFFHAWNVERIRPASLEPFDFAGANVSGELWLAEGVTNYYGALVMQRAGLVDIATTLARFEATIETVATGPGRQLRSPVEMSQLAPFTDAATAIDPTNWRNTFITYYIWGEAIGLGLDLTLRDRSNGAVTLDDYMRALWERFGRPDDAGPGLVARPYSPDDARAVLGAVAGDQAFADDFFSRFIGGHEMVDYAPLLASAGLTLRPRSPGRAWLGALSVGRDGRVTAPTRYGSPIHEAGLERDDVLTMLDGQRVSSRGEVEGILRSKRPGETLSLEFLRRGRPVESTVTLVQDPGLELVAVESSGGTLTAAQRVFREAWLGSRQ